MFPIIIAFNAIDPASFRDKKLTRPVVNTANPAHCVIARVYKLASLAKLSDSELSAINSITKPNNEGMIAAINRKELRFIVHC